MTRIGLIGGTGTLALAADFPDSGVTVSTPYGDTSSPLLQWQTDTAEICFVARHGFDSSIPPHRVNYRANVWAMQEQQVEYLLGINAVGGIAVWAEPARLVCPLQLIDYSWGRVHTYADGQSGPLQHVDFTAPFDAAVRERVLGVAAQVGLDCHPAGVYAVTQGPRLETAAEIDRLERDGCDIVGMTAMPEAGLARELGLAYAICAVVVNQAAGRGGAGQGIHEEIQASIERGMEQVRRLVSAL